MHRKVHLLGPLAQFGDLWEVEAKAMSDIVRLIDCQTEGFRTFLVEAAEAGLDVAIVGTNLLVENPEELLLENLGSEDVYISLVPAGSKKGWGRVILGIILIIVGVLFPPSAPFASEIAIGLISVGISIALQGITQLLAKTPDADDDKEKSGLFDGPVSTLKSGQPVPILYGELLIGGAPIHVDLSSSNAANIWSVYGAPDGTDIIIDSDGQIIILNENWQDSTPGELDVHVVVDVDIGSF